MTGAAARWRRWSFWRAIRSSNQRNGTLSVDGKWIAAPGTTEDDGRSPVPIHLWDCITGQKAREFGKAPYVAVYLSPDGKTLAALRHEAYVELWDFHAGRLLRSWQTHASNATARALYDKLAEDSGFIVYRMPVA